MIYKGNLEKNCENFSGIRMRTFVCNILKGDPCEVIKEEADFCTMIFFLSSFVRKDIEEILKKINKIIKKGNLRGVAVLIDLFYRKIPYIPLFCERK